jgi:hypothetical protein
VGDQRRFVAVDAEVSGHVDHVLGTAPRGLLCAARANGVGSGPSRAGVDRHDRHALRGRLGIAGITAAAGGEGTQ